MNTRTTQTTMTWMTRLFAAALLAALSIGNVAQAQDVPATMTLQGVLRDAAGVPVQDGVTLHFSLIANDGTELWSEDHSETLRAGLFSITLGDTTAIPASAFAADLPPKLVIAINDDPPSTPSR